MSRKNLIIGLLFLVSCTISHAQEHLKPSTMKDPTVEVKPDDGHVAEEAIVYLKLGNQKIKSGDYRSAVEQYTHALSIEHGFKEALKNRGICYTIMDQDSLAVVDFNRAIVIDPEDHTLYNYRGFALAELQSYTAALADLDKALTMSPNYVDAFMNKGIVYLWMERYDASIEQFNKVIEINPENGKAYYNRGIAHEEAGDMGLACLDWNRSLRLKYKLALKMVSQYCE